MYDSRLFVILHVHPQCMLEVYSGKQCNGIKLLKKSNIKHVHHVVCVHRQWRIQDLTLGGMDFVNRGRGEA